MNSYFKTFSGRTSSADGFLGEFYPTFKEVIIPTLQRHLKKTEKEKTLNTSFYEAYTILIRKPSRDLTRKLQAINTVINFFIPMLVNQIQQSIKKIIYYHQMGYIPEC